MAKDGRVAGNQQPGEIRHEATKADAGQRSTDLTKGVSELRVALARVERQQEQQQQRLLEGIQKERQWKEEAHQGLKIQLAHEGAERYRQQEDPARELRTRQEREAEEWDGEEEEEQKRLEAEEERAQEAERVRQEKEEAEERERLKKNEEEPGQQPAEEEDEEPEGTDDLTTPMARTGRRTKRRVRAAMTPGGLSRPTA